MNRPAVSSPEPPTGPRPLGWSLWRILGVLVSAFLLTAVAYVWIGPPLRPWDDLKPEPIPPLPAQMKNGREFLRMKWEPLRAYASSGKLSALQDSVMGWDESDPEMTAGAKRGTDRLTELREALAMPGWRAQDYQRVSGQYVDQIHLGDALVELSALICQHIHAGRVEQSAEVILLLAEAATREIQTAPMSDGLWQGMHFERVMLQAIPPFLAAATPEDDSLCLKLQGACRAESITSDRIKACLLREVESRCHDLLALPRQERVPEKDWPESRGYRIGGGVRRFFLNSKATVNLFHQALRAAVPRLLTPVPQATDSLKGLKDAYSLKGKWWWYAHPNIEGRHYVADELMGWYALDEAECRFHLFQQRAAAVRIALHRWQLAKGRLPDRLEELVPVFLDAVPADPYDGRPLRWISSGGGLLYGLGSDWTDDATLTFPLTGSASGYFNDDGETPALRLVLPAPAKSGP